MTDSAKPEARTDSSQMAEAASDRPDRMLVAVDRFDRMLRKRRPAVMNP